MSIKVASEFLGRGGGWSCFFATTYSYEFELFDEYLFRRLGEPPVNATVLCDFNRLARRLAGVEPDEASRVLQRANRDYLLRGVAMGRAFHAKTYFFGNAKGGVLLVGSGNLSLRGIEQGYEVFCRFDSQNEAELGTIRGWREWAEAIVGRADDPELSHRWLDLKARTGEWLLGSAEGSQFVSNLERSLAEQLVERCEGSVSELHVLAPFYDENALALAELVDRLAPSRLVVYLGAETSVNGVSLAKLVRRFGAHAELVGFDPHEFVHAKLIGAVVGERGWLLSGSANLSRAALSATLASDSYANVEAGILVEADAEAVRAAFCSPRLSPRPESLASVEALVHTSDEAGLGLPLHLLAARLLDDGLAEVTVEGSYEQPLFLTAGIELCPLEGKKTTRALAKPEGGKLVWLCDAESSPLSNRALLDDPAALRGWLTERTSARDAPAELDAFDVDQPVGELLLWLHRECIFDIDDTPAVARISRRAGEEIDASTDWSFLEELAKEGLRLDPRVDRYPHAGVRWLEDDQVFALLQLMLEETPQARALHLVHPVRPDKPPGGEGTPWTLEQRLQVRVFNVLHRWSAALADPRFIWIERTAPVRNFSALLVAIARCWEEGYLPVDRVLRLLETLMTSFIGADRVRGYLLSVNEDVRTQALAGLSAEARSLAAALCYCALRETAPWREWVFRIQPFLVPALEMGVVAAGHQTPVAVNRIVGERPTPIEIDRRLLFAAIYLDDPHWCKKQERELGISKVELTHRGFHARFGITLAVTGISSDDPRLVALVRHALAYRRDNGAVVEVGGDRIAVKLGEPLHARIGEVSGDGAEDMTLARLAELERSGIGFAHLLARFEAATS